MGAENRRVPTYGQQGKVGQPGISGTDDGRGGVGLTR
jgi:hypothetical protein